MCERLFDAHVYNLDSNYIVFLIHLLFHILNIFAAFLPQHNNNKSVN